jgi:hypothetical protein
MISYNIVVKLERDNVILHTPFVNIRKALLLLITHIHYLILLLSLPKMFINGRKGCTLRIVPLSILSR